MIQREIGLGTVAEYSTGELLDRGRYLYGVHEYATSSVFVMQATPGSMILDIGANLGEYSILAAHAVGPKGRVLAFEPNPNARRRLLRNLELNDISNVEVLPCAAGSSDSQGLLHVPGDMGLGTLQAGVSGTEYHVPIRTVDGVVNADDWPRISAIKVDVEGWELQVFEGAQQTLAGAMPVVLYECWEELFEWHDSRMATPSMLFLEGLGYRHFVPRMSRRGMWNLLPIEEVASPIEFREPWATLMLVAIHPKNSSQVSLSGQSRLKRCGILETLGRSRAPLHDGPSRS